MVPLTLSGVMTAVQYAKQNRSIFGIDEERRITCTTGYAPLSSFYSLSSRCVGPSLSIIVSSRPYA